MGRKVILAVTTLNQWALDFSGNLKRIIESIQQAKSLGARFRTGPELEISGYNCGDHFYESDTFLHSWEVLAELLKHPVCENMLVDVGMPVMHKNVAYNCRVVFLNRRVLLIRPKLILCDSGNYRESRWFTAWRKMRKFDPHYLPRMISEIMGQKIVPFGDALIATEDTCIGFEICEELWNPCSSHIAQSLDGAEIIVNGSGSHMELRKAYISDELIRSASFKSGGAYLFSNLRGCDGERVVFNGCSAIALNGSIIAKGQQFSLKEVEVTVATVDMEDIRMYKNRIRSRSVMAAVSDNYERIVVEFALTCDNDVAYPSSEPIKVEYHTPEEEISFGMASWLWDYLRRSGQGGYFLPLSGGVDSSSSACIVSIMCHMVVDAINLGDKQVLEDVQKILGDPKYVPKDGKELCNQLLVTCYMGTENSSAATSYLAGKLSSQIGSYHLSITIDLAVSAVLGIFTAATGLIPMFRAYGGSARENLALQNVQARLRMVLAYLFAQLMLWIRGRPGGLLVVGSANVDESLRGYMTKYDCSSADVNPIGGICKEDLRKFLQYTRDKYNYTALSSILDSPPTAELEPLLEGHIAQTDEEDMGMTYSELNLYGRLRKQHCCGPLSMFTNLIHQWKDRFTAMEIANKVKAFFRFYSINRHKMTVLTPGVHAESYSPDDNRFDLRPFLYNVNWTWQFERIDMKLKKLLTFISHTSNTVDKEMTESSEKVHTGHLNSNIDVTNANLSSNDDSDEKYL